MSATARLEQTDNFLPPVEVITTLPPVMSVPETLPTDMRAEQLIRSLGARALEDQLETVPSHEAEYSNLMEAIKAAAAGDNTARALVETNVRTDVIERTIKAGHVMEVELEIAADGSIMQHGQTMTAIQANTLRYASALPQMRARAIAETRNAFDIDSARRLGLLEEYNFVVFSPAADDMTTEQMDDVGFFTETMSLAIQSTSFKDGRLTTESAFVAGVPEPGEERQDRQIVGVVGESLGVNLDKPATEMIRTALLISKDLMPNGVVDMVRLMDDVNGTFFGEAKPRQDYQDYRRQCDRRSQSFEPSVQKIVNELLAAAPAITTPVEAAQLLQRLSGKQMIEKAVFDPTINPRVFGRLSAAHIEMARWHQEQGNEQQAIAEVSSAIKADSSRSCPGGAAGESNTTSSSDGTKTTNKETTDNGNCEFVSKQCPICKKKNVKTVVTKTHIRGDCGCTKRK